jgi:N-acetylmuramoyl-L-alanine amidase
MIILTKKKIIYAIGIIAMFMDAHMVIGYNTNNKYKKEVRTIETVALPVNNKIIVIDAGHGVPDERCGK